MEELCTGCMCGGRKLYLIEGSSLHHVYSQILNEISIYNLSELCVKLCWECHALLRRFEAFKHRVRACYMEIIQYLHNGGQQTYPMARLPNLQIHHNTVEAYPDIKDEIDYLADDQHDPTFVQHDPTFSQHDPTFGQHDPTLDEEMTYNIKDEHLELQTFANDLIVKKDDEGDDEKKEVNKSSTKPPKEKKKKGRVKKNAKKKTKKNLIEESEIKSDDSNHDVDTFSQFEENGEDEIREDKYGEEESRAEKYGEEESRVEKYGEEEIREEKYGEEENKYEPEEKLKEEVEDKNCDINLRRNREKTTENKIGALKDITIKKIPPKLPKPAKVLNDGSKPICSECGKEFSSKKTLRYHLNVLHKGNNNYPCPKCGKVYQWKSNLGRHLRSHKARETGELHCAACDKSFSSVATFRQHLSGSRQHVTEDDFCYTCDECGKKFVSKVKLRDHIDWEHLRHIKFRCTLCNNKPFKCHTSLYVHMKNVHAEKGLRDNLCHVCGKSYQNRAKLRYHIVAMHTAATPYRCATCGAAFGWYSSLYRHVREVHYKMKVQQKAKKSKRAPPRGSNVPPPALPPSAMPPPPAPLLTHQLLQPHLPPSQLPPLPQ